MTAVEVSVQNCSHKTRINDITVRSQKNQVVNKSILWCTILESSLNGSDCNVI